MTEINQLFGNNFVGEFKVIIIELIIIFIVYILIAKIYKNRVSIYRIQSKERINNNQIKRELKNSFYTLLVNILFTIILVLFLNNGYSKIYTDIGEYNFYWTLFSILFLLFFDDTWFYWYHRFLHIPKVFKNIHFEHHKSFDVNPISSMSFHFVEPFFLFFWIIPIVFLIPIYAPVLFFVQILSVLNNIKSHIGYEFYPSWWNKSIFSILTSSTHHNMHHSKINGNYGAHFRIWDKIMGTEFKDYEDVFNSLQHKIIENKKS